MDGRVHSVQAREGVALIGVFGRAGKSAAAAEQNIQFLEGLHFNTSQLSDIATECKIRRMKPYFVAQYADGALVRLCVTSSAYLTRRKVLSLEWDA